MTGTLRDRTTIPAALVAVVFVALVLAGCSGSVATTATQDTGGASTATGTSSSNGGSGSASGSDAAGGSVAPPATGGDPAAILTAPLDVQLSGIEVSKSVGPDGGTLDVTGRDGTAYRLDVPKDALTTTVQIAASPVASLGAGLDARAVVFQPSGLRFALPVTITATPPQPIPVERQVLFTFTDDGAAVWAAEPKLDTADIVFVTDHFSGYGFADLADKVREKYVKWKTDRAADRISSELAEVLQAERQRQMLGGEDDGTAADAMVKAIDAYERDVVAPRLANADTSCAAAKEAIATALGLERQRQLLGMPSGAAGNKPALDLGKLVSLGLKPCEKEAIDKCKAAKDPAVLLQFWIGANRQAQLLGGASPFPVDIERAKAICDPKAYVIVGGLEDWQVNQRVCNILEPFTLSSGIGRMTMSGGLSGTYTFGGVFNSRYTGKYRFSFPDGMDKPGTLVGSGGGSIAGQAGSGTERYTVTPNGPC